MVETILTADVLVIGGGAAGSLAAIRARESGADVALVSKGAFGRDGASTWMAGPAFQAALYPPDSPEVHAGDVIRVGRYVADQDVVHAYTCKLPEVVQRISEWGVRFRKEGGRFTQTRLPGETYPRVVDRSRIITFSGPQYRLVLPRQVRRLGVRTVDDMFVSDLLVNQGRVCGALALDIREGKAVVLRAKTVVLATGGYMGCYPRTVTPCATGDGSSMAYRSRAQVADMEFTDFYTYVSVWPPVCKDEEWPALIAYFLTGMLYNRGGEEYMRRYTGARRVPPKATALELRAGRGSPRGGVYLSLKHLPTNLVNDYLSQLGHERWLDGLREYGFDVCNEAVEVAPAGITSFGGCKINARCEASLEGLYAAGEVAAGHQGAYVMVGNMVGSSVAMGSIAGEQAAGRAARMALPDLDARDVENKSQRVLDLARRPEGVRPSEARKMLQRVLNEHAYLVGRTDAGLRRGLEELRKVRADVLPRMSAGVGSPRFNLAWVDALQTLNLADIAELVMTSALRRTESRGCHYRDDYPEENPEWLRRIVITQHEGGNAISEEPVAFTHVKPPAKAS